MLRFVMVACAFAACFAAPQDKPAATPPQPPSPQPQGVYCGETPKNIFNCLENPKVINKEIAVKCSRRHLSECDSMKCIFRESGWAEADDKVNKQKVAQYFNEYVLENANWTAAVRHLKAACLDKELPPQGATQDCAPYDVMHCILNSFIRNAPASLWRPTAECTHPRAFAGACPYCPSSCFAPQVPYGTCNACVSLPRTP